MTIEEAEKLARIFYEIGDSNVAAYVVENFNSAGFGWLMMPFTGKDNIAGIVMRFDVLEGPI